MIYQISLYQRLQIMSIRNKKLTTLQSIHHSLQNSIEKPKNIRQHSNDDKLDKTLLEKLADKPIIRRFQVRKLPLNQSEPSPSAKPRFKSLRIHTEKAGSQKRQFNSPQKNSLANPYERSHTIPMKQIHEGEKQQKYGFLTKFEKEQIQKYEVFHIGSRRIHSLKDFTSSSCEARVSIGDSVAYRYQVISTLGQGSFGQVFKSFDHKKKQMVALKVIRNEAKFNKQAKVEIKILENVMIFDPKFKSNIVQLKHAFFFRGHACLVFQLLHINLYELSKKLKFNGLGMDMIRRITIQVLQGLLFLKRQNIIHCDLKPQNILLKQENKSGIKIIDLGSGCFENQQIYTYIQSRFYRAPEIILGITYTPAIDIWSMGCILCELFLGYPIFPGENEQEQMLMFMEVLGAPPSSLIERGSRSSKFFEGNLVRIKPNTKGKIRRPSSKSLQLILSSCEDQQFINFVKKFFIWEPENRITPVDALMDPWILKGLPSQIKKQHITSINKQTYF